MPSADYIDSILKRGAQGGIESLSRSERMVWLISEAEILCDMDGIDSFLDRYEEILPEVADSFARVGAIQIAENLRAIHAKLPSRPEEFLDQTNALVTDRAGYDAAAVARLISGAT